MKRKGFLGKKVGWVSLVLICLVIFSVAGAQAAKTIKVATVALPGNTLYKGLEKWQSTLAERSDGELKVEILGRGVMGGDREMIEGCRMGTLNAGVVSGSVISNVVPQYVMISLPYLFRTHEEANAFLDGPIGQKLFKMLEEKQLVGLGWSTWSFRGVWCNVRPIHEPKDMKGLKLRCLETPLDMSITRHMGATPTPMAWSEALLGLRQGTVDGITTTFGLGYHLKLYDIADYASRTRHYYESAPLIMSKELFDSFSPEEQKMIKETAAESLLWSRKIQEEFEKTKAAKLLEEEGTEVNSLSEETRAKFKEITEPVYEEFRFKVGSDFMDEALSFVESLRE